MVRWKWLFVIIGSVALPPLLVALRNVALAGNPWGNPMPYAVLVGIAIILVAKICALRRDTEDGSALPGPGTISDNPAGREDLTC